MSRRDRREIVNPGGSSAKNVPGADSRITPGGWRSLDAPESSRTKYQLVAFGVFVVLATLFVALNSSKVETRFIVFSVVTPLWVGLVVTLSAGIVVGWFLHVHYARRSRSDDSAR